MSQRRGMGLWVRGQVWVWVAIRWRQKVIGDHIYAYLHFTRVTTLSMHSTRIWEVDTTPTDPTAYQFITLPGVQILKCSTFFPGIFNPPAHISYQFRKSQPIGPSGHRFLPFLRHKINGKISNVRHTNIFKTSCLSPIRSVAVMFGEAADLGSPGRWPFLIR